MIGATLPPMIFRTFLMLAFVLPMPALAAERELGVGSFTRLRVSGAFDVRVAPGSPRVRISGNRDAIDAVDAHVDGETLVVRPTVNGIWGGQPASRAAAPVVVTITTPSLVNLTLIGNGKVSVTKMAGPRIGVAVTGTGSVAVDAVQADQIDAQLIGTGTLAVAGRTASARFVTNGPGTIVADKLDAGDVVIRLDGLGSTTASARFTAAVTNTGLGSVNIAGNPKCTVRADAGGPVSCGGR